MPFNEVLTIKSTGGGSWQNDFAIKTKLSSEEVYAAGKTRAAALGDPADHVEATTAEVHQYHKVINYPAKTYPHGVFFLLNSQKAVVACSANTENFFGVDASSLLGKTFSELFQSPTKVSAALAAEDYFTVSPVVTKSKGGAASTVNIILQRGPNGVMADVEPLGDESAIESQVAAAKSAAGKFESCQTEQELCDQMTAVMKELWGWDRQLVWKFNDDDTSTMVSEKKNDTVKVPLAGLTMYGVDMPPNARLGFLHRTYSRTTADVSAAGVDLVTDERFIAPEDVSLQKSTLRQVHQCAVEQYGEWDTRSCATFAVIVQRRLWGLCLHSGTGPNPLPPFQVRMAMEQLTNAFALRLAKLLDAELAARGEAFNAFVTALSTQAASASDEVGKLQTFLDASPEVAKALPAVSSVAVYHKGKMHAAGAVSAADAQKVVGKVLETWKPATKEATAYRSLTDLSPELASVSGAAGVIAVPLLSDSVLLLFRPDANATVTYAGVPKVVYNRVTGTMHSRRDSSSPTAVKQSGCTAWSPTDMDAARAFSAALGGVVSGSPAAPGAGAIGVDSAATAEVAERFRRLEERVGQLVAELKEK